MTSFWFHVPPLPESAEATKMAGPPSISNLRNSPPAKKARERLSGDQNGRDPPCVRSKALGSGSSRNRIHRRFSPEVSLTPKTIFLPSGETSAGAALGPMGRMMLPAGGVTWNRNVTGAGAPRDGRFIEILGWYDPNLEGQNFELKLDKIEKWVGNGAQLSDTVASMVRRARRDQTTIDEPVEVPEAIEVVEVTEPEVEVTETTEEGEEPVAAEKAEESVA